MYKEKKRTKTEKKSLLCTVHYSNRIRIRLNCYGKKEKKKHTDVKDVVVKSRLRDGSARHRILQKIVIVSLPESIIVVVVVDEFLISSRCKQSWSLGTCITPICVYTHAHIRVCPTHSGCVTRTVFEPV